jgi:hypothetical protein
MGILFLLSDVKAIAPPYDSVTSTINLKLNYYGYLSNYEYFNPIQPGFTLFGNSISPQLLFIDGKKNIQFSTGVFLQEEFGNRDFNKVLPVFNFKFQLRKVITSFGKIYNESYHNLPKPLYNPDNLIFDPIENGEQIIYKSKYVNLDQWVAWKRNLYANSTGQEKISAGFSSIVNSNEEKIFHIKIPIAALFFHQGGQIGFRDSTYFTSTQINLLAGVQFDYKLKSIINNISLRSSIMNYRNNISDTNALIKNGFALLSSICFDARYGLSFTLLHWYSQNFISPLGDFIYQSKESPFANNSYYVKNRNLIFASLSYKYEDLDNTLQVRISFDPYYDLYESLFEYAYRIQINYSLLSKLYSYKEKKRYY